MSIYNYLKVVATTFLSGNIVCEVIPGVYAWVCDHFEYWQSNGRCHVTPPNIWAELIVVQRHRITWDLVLNKKLAEKTFQLFDNLKSWCQHSNCTNQQLLQKIKSSAVNSTKTNCQPWLWGTVSSLTIHFAHSITWRWFIAAEQHYYPWQAKIIWSTHNSHQTKAHEKLMVAFVLHFWGASTLWRIHRPYTHKKLDSEEEENHFRFY